MYNSRTGTNWPVLLSYLFIYLFLLFALWFMSSRLTAAMESNVQRESNLGFSSPIAITSHMTRPHCVCYLSDLLLFFLSSKKILRSFSFNLRSFGCHGMRRRSPCLALAPRWSSLTNHGHARPSWPSHHLIWQLGSLCVTVTVRRRMDPVATRCAPLRRANERTGGAGGRKCNAEADEQDKSTQPFPISTGIDTTSQRWATRGWPLVQ